MRLRGLEPPRGCPHGDLNAACIPISPQPLAAARVAISGSRLDADMLEQPRHILSSVEPDRGRVASRTQADRETRGFEQVEDVGREVGEAVAHILVWAGAVDEDTPVRADAATEEPPRSRGHDLRLPGLERDAPEVLLARRMLRQQAGQMPVVQ